MNELGELSDHEDRWESLRKGCEGTIYASYPFSKLWLEAFRGIASPRILLVEDRGDLVGVAPLILKRQRIAGIPVRTLMLIGNSRGELGFSPVNVLTETGSSGAVDAMITRMNELEWNVLRTSFMEDNAATRQYVAGAQAAWEQCQLVPSPAIARSLPEDGDVAGLLSRSTRKRLFRVIRDLEREDRMEFRAIPLGEIDDAVDTYAKQHIERWRDKGGSYFRDPRNAHFLGLIAKESLSRGFGYAYELLIDGEVAAQKFGFMEGDKAWGYRAGMNVTFAEHSPGLIATYCCMNDLIGRGIRSMSLGAGDEEHKRHFGGQEVPLVSLNVLRGTISWLSAVISSAPVRRLDAALGIRQRLFKEVYK